MLDIAISYSHASPEHRDALVAALAHVAPAQSISVWTDQQLRGGERWEDVLPERYANADLVVGLVTRDWLESEYSQRVEVLRGVGRRLLLVRVEGVEVPSYLTGLTWVPSGRPVLDRPPEDRASAWREVAFEVLRWVEGPREEPPLSAPAPPPSDADGMDRALRLVEVAWDAVRAMREQLAQALKDITAKLEAHDKRFEIVDLNTRRLEKIAPVVKVLPTDPGRLLRLGVSGGVLTLAAALALVAALALGGWAVLAVSDLEDRVAEIERSGP